MRDHRPRLSVLFASVGALVVLLGSTSLLHGQQGPDGIETAIAIQPFQHGFMLWRQDNGQITVGFADIPAKSGAACQEVYRDTWQDQPYEIPAAPPGLTTPIRGFGWLYANDLELARRLGYATADETGQIAPIRTMAGADGPTIEVQLSEPIAGFHDRLTLASTDTPGLTYCFARRADTGGAELRTWIALQRFEYGFMVWRQDRPDRIEVLHSDTELAPELTCADVFVDSWRPGEELSYGDLAIPGRRLPVRGFGKVWLEHPYVRESLGYPITSEIGAFAEITYEPFRHPHRGELLVRKLVADVPGGQFVLHEAIAGGLEAEYRPNQECRRVLIPHDR
jgi:hypothetical protein